MDEDVPVAVAAVADAADGLVIAAHAAAVAEVTKKLLPQIHADERRS